MSDAKLVDLIAAIAAGDEARTGKMLEKQPDLARKALDGGATRQRSNEFFFAKINHYAYEGDTALHIASAAYDLEMVRALLALGADVLAANRRGANPLHYAADGAPGSAHWSPRAQASVIAYLIKRGADPNARDKSGVTPLHRAIRTRCAAAVRALLKGGADASLPNEKASTPMDLAVKQTGRGGSGSPEAKRQQAEIIRLLSA